MNILSVSLTHFFVMGLIFAAFIYPIWAIVHCAISKEKSNKAKIFWIIGMLIAGFLVSIIYGLFGARRKFFQWISLGIIITITLFLTMLFSEMKKESGRLDAQIAGAIVKTDSLTVEGLTGDDLQELKKDLLVLRKEAGFRLSNLRRLYSTGLMMDLFNKCTIDNKITAAEYKNWKDKFNKRADAKTCRIYRPSE